MFCVTLQLQHIKKAKEMEEEMIYGSKPVTPGKRRFIGTPAKTPNSKLRKVRAVLILSQPLSHVFKTLLGFSLTDNSLIHSVDYRMQ